MFLNCMTNNTLNFINNNNPDQATVVQEMRCSGFVEHVTDVVVDVAILWIKGFLIKKRAFINALTVADEEVS